MNRLMAGCVIYGFGHFMMGAALFGTPSPGTLVPTDVGTRLLIALVCIVAGALVIFWEWEKNHA